MNYHITDPDTLHKIIRRVCNRTGLSGFGPVTISLHDADKSTGMPLIEADGVADREIFYEGKKTRLTLRVEPLGINSELYRIKEAFLGHREMKGRSRFIDSTVQYSLPVDVNSSIALYGRSARVVQRVSRMEQEIRSAFQRTGYGIRDCTIGFFYNSRTDIIHEIEEDGRPFILLDSLRKLIVQGADFFTPQSYRSGERENLFLSYNLSKIRSEFIYPFSDHQKNPMGYFRVNSPSPMPGRNDSDRAGDFAYSVLSYLNEKSEDLLYLLEKDIRFPYKHLSDNCWCIDLDSRSLILVISQRELPADLLPGSRIMFHRYGTTEGSPVIATVKNSYTSQEGMSLLLRVQENTLA